MNEKFIDLILEMAKAESVALDRIRYPWSSTFEDSVLMSPMLPINCVFGALILFLWAVFC